MGPMLSVAVCANIREQKAAKATMRISFFGMNPEFIGLSRMLPPPVFYTSSAYESHRDLARFTPDRESFPGGNGIATVALSGQARTIAKGTTDHAFSSSEQGSPNLHRSCLPVRPGIVGNERKWDLPGPRCRSGI